MPLRVSMLKMTSCQSIAISLEGKGGVHGIAEWIEDGGCIAIDSRIMTPNVRHGQRDELGKAPRAVHSDSRCVSAEVTQTRHAIAASTADHMTFAGNDFTRMEIVDISANL